MNKIEIHDEERPKEFKGKIGYDQGKTNIISFYGYVYLDNLDAESISQAVSQLFTMHKAVEGVFRINNYKVASDKQMPSPPKE